MSLPVASGQAMVSGPFGGQRLLVGPAIETSIGVTGVLQRESSLNDVVGRGEGFRDVYGHRLGGRESSNQEIGTGSIYRAGRSFVAYIVDESRVHGIATGGGKEHHLAAITSVPPSSVSRRGVDEDESILEAIPWTSGPQATIVRARNLSLDDSRHNITATLQETNARRDIPDIDATQHNLQELQVQKIDEPRQRGRPTSNACQDCGNQAKKDCSHLRCRTCCKGRGFHCLTHIKSTWVPVSKRRERQHLDFAGRFTPKSKRTRSLALASGSNEATSHIFASTGMPFSSGVNSLHHPYQEAHTRRRLPSEVRTQAVFKCVRVTGIDNGEDEFAYQAIVKIEGHIFKGMLFDHGSDGENGPSNVPDLQLGGRSISTLNSVLVDPTRLYGASSNAFLGGN